MGRKIKKIIFWWGRPTSKSAREKQVNLFGNLPCHSLLILNNPILAKLVLTNYIYSGAKVVRTLLQIGCSRKNILGHELS
jgi:hypothetical protein